jgi:hypothetical protein
MFESRKGNRDSRVDFERDLRILEENLKNGRIKFSPSTKKHANDLLKVRHSPNRRIDLNTISEIVRTFAMSANFNREL